MPQIIEVPGMGEVEFPDDMSDEQSPTEKADESGQVSEVTAMDEAADPIYPEDATAGYPTSESGEPEEGTAGPAALPRHTPPEEGNKSSR